jgi:hypothetical protein
VVEALADVARHLDVLDLVAPDRHLVRLEDQDVGRHQHRIHVQAGVDAGVGILALLAILVCRRLVRVRAVQQSLGRDAVSSQVSSGISGISDWR